MRDGQLPEGVTVDNDLDLSRYNKFWITKRGDVITQSETGPRSARVRRTYKLHRVVMGVDDPSVEVDHINHNRLDNRRANLRACAHRENGRNLPLKSNNTSGFPGVRWDSSRDKWVARIKIDRTDKHLGRYDSFEEAVSARLFGEDYYFGEFAPNLKEVQHA